MTRFGVMKHLRVLEQAGLVVTRRQSYRALCSEDAKAEGTSRVTWEIEKVGDSWRLCITHDQLREGAPPELYGGWPMVLSGPKTLLETGSSSLRQAHLATWASNHRFEEREHAKTDTIHERTVERLFLPTTRST